MNECEYKTCSDPCEKQCGCKDPCGCPLRVLGIEAITDKPGLVKFNLDGGTVFFDFGDIVKETETDTFLRVDSTARLLKYLAEGHTNNITAKQLGSILHLADIGDINVDEVTQNSLLAYQKNSDCGQSCGSNKNTWVAWNADEHLANASKSVMVFDDDGAPKALDTPVHTDQYYLAGWRAGGKFGYTQPVEVSVPTTDSNGKTKLLFENPTTHQLEALPVVVNIDGSGNVTFNTQGGA